MNEADVLKTKFKAIYDELKLNNEHAKANKWDQLVRSEEFEKDDDKNFHIDFMHALGNCRSINYVLEPMDWI